MLNNTDLYMCAIYMPPDRNIFYKKYNCNVFEILQKQIEYVSSLGTVSVLGDINGWVVTEKDFIFSDVLDKQLLNDIKFLEYDFVCLYTYEFWLSFCKIVRSSVILLLPLWERWTIR